MGRRELQLASLVLAAPLRDSAQRFPRPHLLSQPRPRPRSPAACSYGRLLQGVGVEGSGRLPGSHAGARPRFLDEKDRSFPGLQAGSQRGPVDHAAAAVCDEGQAEGSSAGVGEP